MDRISKLPDGIIHQIMSHLSAKDVARTSILSRKWNRIRKSFPVLDFDQTFFVKDDVNYRNFSIKRQRKKFGMRIKKFIKFVDASLDRFCQHKLCMQKLRLFISVVSVKRSLSVKRATSFVDKWIGLAVEHGVKELDFEVLTSGFTTYTLSQTIFSARLATTLKLAGCKLEQSSEPISFHSLRKLTLVRVCINEQMVQKLIRECPSLEDLCFTSCWGLKHLCVSEAVNLKIMKVDSPSHLPLQRVEISVPNLQELTLRFSPVRKPQVIDIARCKHLKKLSLWSFNISEQEFHHLISEFPLLEHLTVCYSYLLERITISSNKLKELRFASCRNLKTVDVNTSTELKFSYEYSPFDLTGSIDALCTRIEYVCRPWCCNVEEFLRSSSETQFLNIFVTKNMTSSDLEQFRRNCRLLPCQVRCLILAIEPPSDYKSSDSDYMMFLLDSIFKVCRPWNFFLETSPFQYELLQLAYDKLKSIKLTANCCCGAYIKCWRHYLQGIKILSFCRREEDDNLRRFSAQELLNLFDKNDFREVWPLLPPGVMWFCLFWCVPAHLRKA